MEKKKINDGKCNPCSDVDRRKLNKQAQLSMLLSMYDKIAI